MSVTKKSKTAVWVAVAVSVCIVVPLVIKFGNGVTAAMTPEQETAKMVECYSLFYPALHSYVAKNGHYPAALTNLDLNFPLSLDEFTYTYTNGGWSLDFAGKFNRYHASGSAQ